MKKYFIVAVLGFILLPALTSCFHHHNLSITETDDDDEFEMDAKFEPHRTHEVKVYLDKHLLGSSVVSVVDRSGKEEVLLDDHSSIYIKADRGRLQISINKDGNSEVALTRVKQICRDLEDILKDY
ncbi:MAG: hypothetical protein WAU23_12865 [Ferruginibacter sp.]